MMKNQKKHQFGFTLIEMIVTVSIAAILSSIAVPSFTKMVERNRVTSGTNEFLSALILARSEAVKRSQNISICVSNPAQTACANSADFADGWLIHTECSVPANGVLDLVNVCDTDNDGVVDATEEIIKVHGQIPQLTVVVDDLAAPQFITYDSSGRSANAGSFNIKIGKDAATITKQIDVSLTGRVRSCAENPVGC